MLELKLQLKLFLDAVSLSSSKLELHQLLLDSISFSLLSYDAWATNSYYAYYSYRQDNGHTRKRYPCLNTEMYCQGEDA
jgi:hypothetical protein